MITRRHLVQGGMGLAVLGVGTGDAAAQARTVASGPFRGVDRAHQAAGTASILQAASGAQLLRFTGFSVTNGPDLKVYLLANANVTASTDVDGAEKVDLGTLKGNRGDQNYTLPAGTDTARFRTVVIWCRPFSVMFASAVMA